MKFVVVATILTEFGLTEAKPIREQTHCLDQTWLDGDETPVGNDLLLPL